MDPTTIEEVSNELSRPSLQDFGGTSPIDTSGLVGPRNPSGTTIPNQQQTTNVRFDSSTLTSGGQNVFNISSSFAAFSPPDVRERSSTSPAITPGTSPSDPSVGTPTLMRIAQAPEHDSEVYARLLLPKKFGWPLWLPNPRTTLPACYREQGVSIGDVGIISVYGEFDFLFNICRPMNDPININGVPNHFVPLSPPSDGDVSIEPDAWKPGAYVLNGSIRARGPQPPGASIIMSFECSPSEGAISVLPTGGARQDLLNIIDFFEYAGENADHWYEFVNTSRRKGGLGRGAYNGALYLITGFDKTSSWGTGSFAGVTGKGTFPIHFQEHAATDESDYAFAWSQSDLAATKHGPKMTEAERINPQQNQCMFLRGFRVAVAESIWERLFHRQATKVEQISNMSLPRLLSKSVHIPFASGSNSGLPGYFNHSQGAGSSNTDAEGDGAIVVPDFPLSSSTLHPSDVINSYLLNQDKDAKVAITHDSQWCSVLEDGASKLPSPSEMLDRMSSSYERVTVNDITYFSHFTNDQAIGMEVTWETTPNSLPAKATNTSAVPATTLPTDVPLATTNIPPAAPDIAGASSPAPAPVSTTSAPLSQQKQSSGADQQGDQQPRFEQLVEGRAHFEFPGEQRKYLCAARTIRNIEKVDTDLTEWVHDATMVGKATDNQFHGGVSSIRVSTEAREKARENLIKILKGGESKWITGQTEKTIEGMRRGALLDVWEEYVESGRNSSIKPLSREAIEEDFPPGDEVELKNFIIGYLAVTNGESAD